MTKKPNKKIINSSGIILLAANFASLSALAQSNNSGGAQQNCQPPGCFAPHPPPPHPPPHPPPPPHPRPTPEQDVKGDPFETELSTGTQLINRLNLMGQRSGLGKLESKLYWNGTLVPDETAERFLMVSIEVYQDLLNHPELASDDAVKALAADILSTAIITRTLDGSTAVKVLDSPTPVIFIDPAIHEKLGYNLIRVRALHMRLFGRPDVDQITAAYAAFIGKSE